MDAKGVRRQRLIRNIHANVDSGREADRKTLCEQRSTTELYGLMIVALRLALQKGTCKAPVRHCCKASSESSLGCTKRKTGEDGHPLPPLQSLPSGKLDVLRDRQTMPPEVVQDRRRVPHRVTIPVRADLTASRERIVRVHWISLQPLGLRPAVRPAQDFFQFPP